MDSRSRLDYALFQLTPTRTRCDLVICAGDCKEKLASGLLEPFIAHLKFAKDQISKGGYSITLSAPASASWFTKSTLERFVRFVSTPEVLERFISTEREIANIDSSINTNASSDSQSVHGLDEYSNKSAAYAYKPEGNTNDAVNEEDSKAHLQRVLETRKAVLQREQAMVYARALVAGFETDNLEDLICFADAFESPRLREACLNFMQLCNMKSNDRVWMDAVAAMQAYSHSQYSSYVEDDPVQELRINIQNGNSAAKKQNGSVDGYSSISHGTHLPQYMHSYQGGTMFHPPYQGYPFPGMAIPPYYQGNLPWFPNAEDSRSRQICAHKKRSQKLTQDGDFDSSDSSSGSDSGISKRSSSQKVVIRNINYISSVSDGKAERESEDNLSVSAVNQDLDRTVKYKHESQKVTQQWNIFQNLLMKDVDDKESEKSVSRKFEDPIMITSGNQPEFATKTSTIGKHEEGDWFLGSLPDKAIQEKSRCNFEDHMESKKDVNDPLVVDAQISNKSSDSQLRTQDIKMVYESTLTQKQVEATSVFEPKDLYMVLERDTSGQQVVPAWTPEMESDNNTVNNNHKIIELETPEVNKPKTKASIGKGLERKGSTIEAKSKALSGSRSKKSTATKTAKLKGKSEKEEEKRKKMEELLTQRQKRIAERSASTTKTVKNDKRKAQPASQDMKSSQKAVIRSSTIDRLSAARVVNPKVLPTELKPVNKPKKQANKKIGEPKPLSKPRVTTKGNGVSHTLLSRDLKGSNKTSIRSSTMDHLSATHVVATKVLPTESKPGNKPTKPAKNSNGERKSVSKPTRVTTKENGVSHTLLSQRKAGAEKKKVNLDKVKPLSKNVSNSKNSNVLKKKIADFNNAKQLPEASHIKKLGDGVPLNIGLSTPAQSDKNKGMSDTLHKASSVVQKDIALSDRNDGSAAKKALNSVSFIINEDNGAKQNSIDKMNVEKSSVERSNSRKKWSNLEASSKALSGFKKLLSFGRRS